MYESFRLPFDALLGVLAVALGATTAVSVVLVATRERLPHFATLRDLGWSRVRVAQVVAGQAISVGLRPHPAAAG